MPLVIAHRGASGYRPEHTLAAYELGARQGADYIEPDLVSTADGHLVARHENEISSTTDVAERPEFADRRTAKTIDGRAHSGFFAEDFTLAELRTLRARERIPDLRPANAEHDGRHPIPTFQEIIELAARLSEELGRPVGIYPETKHPSYHRSIGLPLEPGLVAALRRNGLDRASAPVFVQSFEVANLQDLARRIRVPLVQLTSASGRPFGHDRTYAEMTTPEGLREIARYADGLGPDKNQIVPRDAQNRLTRRTSLVDDAHRAGLVVHPYTFRPENEFLPEDFRDGDPASPEYLRARGDQSADLAFFYRLGVDGLFADNPDTAVAVRRRVSR